jgi:membrane protease YdiL (CAAX protease family)
MPLDRVLLILVPQVLIVAPVLEEFVFRGTLHPALKYRFAQFGEVLINILPSQWPFRWIKNSRPEYIGTVCATICTGLVFASIHNNLNAFAPLFVLGMTLSLVYEYTGSIGTSVALHAVFNGFNTAHVILQRVLKDSGWLM